MSLFLSTLLVGLVLLALGASLASNHKLVAAMLRSFPRSQFATILFFGTAAAWFLFRVWHLSPADFGEFRGLLFTLFAAVGVLSFFLVPDFLAVRGLAGLILLAAGPILDSAFMRYELPQRLLLVSVTYLFILAALWLGAQPWRLRDFIEWLQARRQRSLALGAGFMCYGAALVIVSMTY